jgi:enoyl-[acyl-carrier-protein] reductase (NADH)
MERTKHKSVRSIFSAIEAAIGKLQSLARALGFSDYLFLSLE